MRLTWRGFIFAVRNNHTMCDGCGKVRFMDAVAEMAGGANSPSIVPVGKRELLDARDTHKVTFPHHEYDEVNAGKGTTSVPLLDDNMDHRSFFFSQAEITAIRNGLPPITCKHAPQNSRCSCRMSMEVPHHRPAA